MDVLPFSDASAPTIVVRRAGPVATVSFNRPDVLNALDRATLVAFVSNLREQVADPGVRVIVVTGEGRAFCAGDDLAEAATLDSAAFRAHIETFQEVTLCLRSASQPVVAAIRGHAYGGGLELALACDFRIAAHGAQFACPEVRWGLTATNGSTRLLPQLVGDARARSLLLLGEPIDATVALACGLVTEVVEEDRLAAATDQLVARLLTLSPDALALTKQLLNERDEGPLARVLQAETDAVMNAHAGLDAAEGMRAFSERRQPSFTEDS